MRTKVINKYVSDNDSTSRETDKYTHTEIGPIARLSHTGEQVGTAVGNQRRPAKVQVTLYAYLHMNR